MFPNEFFPNEYFAGEYWPPIAGIVVVGNNVWVLWITED